LRMWPGVRRADPEAEPGADAGPAAPQAPPWSCKAQLGNEALYRHFPAAT